MILTSVPLQDVSGHVGTAIEVSLQCVHLPAEDVPEGLHLRQLLPEAVALLRNQSRAGVGATDIITRTLAQTSLRPQALGARHTV